MGSCPLSIKEEEGKTKSFSCFLFPFCLHHAYPVKRFSNWWFFSFGCEGLGFHFCSRFSLFAGALSSFLFPELRHCSAAPAEGCFVWEDVLLLFSCCCGLNTILAILSFLLRAARDVLILSFFLALSLFLRASRTPLSIVFFSGRYVSANAFVSNKSICSFGISFACPVTSSFSKRKSRNPVLTPLNNSNSTNPKLRHAKEWFHESWADLNRFPIRGLLRLHHRRGAPVWTCQVGWQTQGQSQGGGRGQPERIVPEVLENNKQERGYIQTWRMG